MSAQHPTAARGIARAIRQLTVGYVRKRHEDRKTRETRRYTRHAALSLNGDWLEQA
ncbi:type I addiction module toxin, SymE family, partial [Klebsiella pneumoniae]